MIKKHSINNWPEEDRPREKLLRYGERALTNSELLAIILRTGTNGQSAVELARRILQEFGTFRMLGALSLPQWKEIKGLGYAKIAQIKAAIEIGRRLAEEKIKENRPKIASSQDIADILLPRMQDFKKEVFKAIFLNSQNRIIEITDAEKGTVNQAYPIVREIFQKALESLAVFLICAHNHPCGNPKPSKEDRRFTKELVSAGNLLQIKVLDHIIIGNNKYFSFRDKGLI